MPLRGHGHWWTRRWREGCRGAGGDEGRQRHGGGDARPRPHPFRRVRLFFHRVPRQAATPAAAKAEASGEATGLSPDRPRVPTNAIFPAPPWWAGPRPRHRPRAALPAGAPRGGGAETHVAPPPRRAGEGGGAVAGGHLVAAAASSGGGREWRGCGWLRGCRRGRAAAMSAEAADREAATSSRPCTPPQTSWFEFLLEEALLEQHLQKPSPGACARRGPAGGRLPAALGAAWRRSSGAPGKNRSLVSLRAPSLAAAACSSAAASAFPGPAAGAAGRAPAPPPSLPPSFASPSLPPSPLASLPALLTRWPRSPRPRGCEVGGWRCGGVSAGAGLVGCGTGGCGGAGPGGGQPRRCSVS